jgi:SAM-dependent methyltransferase
MRSRRGGGALLSIGMALAVLLALTACSGTRGGRAGAEDAQPPDRSLAPYVVTSPDVVEEALRLAGVGKDDLVYDLGSGDGRIVIAAARRYGARGIGFELEPDLVRRAEENARLAGVSHLVQFRQQDVLTVDLSPATVVTVYLSPEANLLLRPRMQEQLRPGARIVSYEFNMGDWLPDVFRQVRDESGRVRALYLWRIGPRQPGS